MPGVMRGDTSQHLPVSLLCNAGRLICNGLPSAIPLHKHMKHSILTADICPFVLTFRRTAMRHHIRISENAHRVIIRSAGLGLGDTRFDVCYRLSFG